MRPRHAKIKRKEEVRGKKGKKVKKERIKERRKKDRNEHEKKGVPLEGVPLLELDIKRDVTLLIVQYSFKHVVTNSKDEKFGLNYCTKS